MEYVTKQCLLCESGEHVRELYPRTFREEDLTPGVFSARRVTEHFHYRMVKCDCGMVFSREILPENALYDLYADSAFNFGGHTESLRRDYWAPIAPFMADAASKSALEVGCSNGFFLEELVARGFKEVVGFEPSRHAKQSAAPHVRDSIRNELFHGSSSTPGKKFDLVCTFHTLDHLSDPAEFLKHCREVVADDGLIYIIVHDVEALQAKLLGEKSPIIDIEHIYLFSLRTLRQALEKNGFEVVSAGNLKNSYPVDYWLKMFPMPEKPKNWVRGLCRHLGVADLAPAIAAGNIFAVGRLKRSVH
jgi:SAM-dependent methyltransferase